MKPLIFTYLDWNQFNLKYFILVRFALKLIVYDLKSKNHAGSDRNPVDSI